MLTASYQLASEGREVGGGVSGCIATGSEDKVSRCNGHRSNTLDNQCGATITDSSASGASLPLSKRAEEGKQLETV